MRIMFPMVAALTEIRQARRVLDECMAELIKEGKPMGRNYKWASWWKYLRLH